MRKHWISREARADLDLIWTYIAKKSSLETATKFVDELTVTFASLAQSPSAGVRAPDAPVPETRKFSMGNYLIYYQAKRGGIRILRVVHGKRQQWRALRRRPQR